MQNMPDVRIGVVAVSRDCFPADLAIKRRQNLISSVEMQSSDIDIYESPICIVESEKHMLEALKDVQDHGCNALVIYLGNFGPEISSTLLAKNFKGPVMFIAAAEETQNDLFDNRGDAYCGLLNASYNLELRNVRVYIPEIPYGDSKHLADEISVFSRIARALIAVRSLKVISFGPRPQNFIACNAPIKQLFDINVEIQENSELDLFEAFTKHFGDERIDSIVEDMENELGQGNKHPEILRKLAQYEITILDWIDENRGSSEYVTIASKCWPAFQTQFGFVPCYVNSRLTGRGIPIACEVDIYGALSEYIGQCVSNDAVTLLDINNTIPKDMYEESINDEFDYGHNDTFMGFHCGNTCSKKLVGCTMKNQLIMTRTLPADTTVGTLEGDLVPGNVSMYRIQGSAEGGLKAYVAQGEILPVSTRSFGCIGVFAVSEMDRFYRYGLIENQFPHHAAIAFGHYGKELFEVFKYLGIKSEFISYNQPREQLYKNENPFK